MNYVASLVKSGYQPVHFIRTEDELGHPCYYFLMASWENIKRLKQFKDHIIDFKKFGKIIQSGYGHTPSLRSILELKSEYDYDASGLI